MKSSKCNADAINNKVFNKIVHFHANQSKIEEEKELVKELESINEFEVKMLEVLSCINYEMQEGTVRLH